MKLVTFRNGRASDQIGAVFGDRIFALPTSAGGGAGSLRSLIASNGGEALPDWRPEEGAPSYGFDEVTLLPVIPDPPKIVCVGLNYRAHVEETKRTETERPVLFLRVPASQIGHRAPMIRPGVSERFDYEGELAVVIGRPGRHIPPRSAMEHVFGYSCYNDGSVRDWQRHTGQWTPGKNFAGTGAFGPWLVTRDEVPAIEGETLVTRLNGEVVQQAPIRAMIFPIPEIVAYISTFIALEPGDVLVTGTPGGVGDRREPPLYMRPGDRIEVEISGVGRLENVVADEV